MRELKKSVLNKLYTKQGLSTRAVAKRLKTAPSVVFRNLERHQIPIRFGKDWLAEKHLKEGLTVHAMCKLSKMDNTSIRWRMKVWGIPFIKHGKASRKKKASNICATSLHYDFAIRKRSAAVLAVKYKTTPSVLKDCIEKFGIERGSMEFTDGRHIFKVKKDKKVLRPTAVQLKTLLLTSQKG